VYPRIRERASTLVASLQNILDKLRNFVFTCIFQEKDNRSIKEITSKMKGALKFTVKRAKSNQEEEDNDSEINHLLERMKQNNPENI
jgi:hypothetical protein